MEVREIKRRRFGRKILLKEVEVSDEVIRKHHFNCKLILTVAKLQPTFNSGSSDQLPKTESILYQTITEVAGKLIGAPVTQQQR